MPGIFISYRRDDAMSDARQLARRLSDHFGERRVFRDIEDIPKGSKWREVIHDTLAQFNLVLVLIGEHWLDASDAQGRRRLDNPEDTLRAEVSAALHSDSHVIPVLLGNAQMPSKDDLPEELAGLPEWNAHKITEDHYDYDVGKLIEAIEAYIPPRPKIPTWTVSIPIVIVLALLVWQFVPGLPPTPWEEPTPVPTFTAAWTPTLVPTPVSTATTALTSTSKPPTVTPSPTPVPPTPQPTDTPTDIPTPTWTPAPTDTPSPTPVPTPSLIVRAAVGYDGTLDGEGDASDHVWVPVEYDRTLGCLGKETETLAMRALKATPAVPLDGSVDAREKPIGPGLVYQENLPRGKYYLYLRASAEISAYDAVWLSWQAPGMISPQLKVSREDGLKFDPPRLNWQPGEGSYLGQQPIVIDVETPGTHTFIVQMRKAGLVLKSLLLSPNPCDFTTYPCDVEKACGVAP